MRRIAVEWPMVTLGWILMELVFCAVIWCFYYDAFRVYMQRDDGTSHMDWVPAWAQFSRTTRNGALGGRDIELRLH
ncbi:hypothetical protein B0T25DRAFT_576471 [Lasiosphaeria hispida]|uniref:Uncharacterized protein n=1 Tax=Lasiosphaeria hispida TaxID=260671 RepID=A0AAJ0MKQ7_9PEZI|nr:hypothetical protein B0T25DRAFT_576471 [Lasiosphaeria hispida]